jgi:hypothetical protein
MLRCMRRSAPARNQLQLHDGGIADTLDLLQPLGRRVDHLRERAEARQQQLGDRLGIAAGNGGKQQQLKQLIVGHRIRAAGKALLQAVAVARMQREGFDQRALLAAGRGIGEAGAAVLEPPTHRPGLYAAS